MVGIKTFFNNQWGQASDDGAAAAPADVSPVGVGDGIAPLVDRFGRPYVHVVTGGGGGGMATFITPETPPTLANSASEMGDMSSGGAVINVGPTKLYWAHVFSSTNVIRYFQLFDLAAFPANGTTPAISVRIPTSNSEERDLILDWNPLGWFFGTGLVWAMSSTRQTLTFTGVGAGNEAGYSFQFSS